LHVCTPFPEHWASAGAHTPWHSAVLPAAMHVWLEVVQLPEAFTQVPVPLHSCTRLLLQRCCPGPHTPVQAPLAQVRLAAHATGAPHRPLASHVSTPLPEHCAAVGLHSPVHVPVAAAQTYSQTAPSFCQAPAPSHSWG
jgi:hypothetical protein